MVVITIRSTLFIYCFKNKTNWHLHVNKIYVIERVSKWLLFNAKCAICQLYHDENKLHSIRSWWCLICRVRVTFMVFNATFNNNSVISWRSVLLVKETRVPPACHNSLTNFITYNVASSTPSLRWIQTHNISGDRHWLHS